MKILIATISLSGLLLAASPSQAELKYSKVDRWMQRIIAPPTTELPIDENFIALAKAASANVFADVSRIDAAQNVLPFAERQTLPVELYPVTLGTVIEDFSDLTALTYDRSTSDTLVFWHRPDMRRLLDLVVAYQKQMDAAHPAGDETTTIAALQKYFEENYAWKAKAQTVADFEERARGIDATIPLATLPPELRSLVETEFRAQIRLIGGTQTYQVLDRAAWKDARFIFAGGNRRDANWNLISTELFPQLMLSKQDGRRWRVGFPQFASKEATDAAALETAQMTKAYTFSKPQPPSLYQGKPQIPGLTGRQAPQAQAQVEVTVPHLDLGADTSLQTTVAFSVKRQPLALFLAALQKQSGVKLQLPPGTFKDAILAANSAGMSLSDAMKALERLYAAHWKQEGATFLLESGDLDEMRFHVTIGLLCILWFPRRFHR